MISCAPAVSLNSLAVAPCDSAPLPLVVSTLDGSDEEELLVHLPTALDLDLPGARRLLAARIVLLRNDIPADAATLMVLLMSPLGFRPLSLISGVEFHTYPRVAELLRYDDRHRWTKDVFSHRMDARGNPRNRLFVSHVPSGAPEPLLAWGIDLLFGAYVAMRCERTKKRERGGLKVMLLDDAAAAALRDPAGPTLLFDVRGLWVIRHRAARRRVQRVLEERRATAKVLDDRLTFRVVHFDEWRDSNSWAHRVPTLYVQSVNL